MASEVRDTMMPYNISSWHDISMMGYDARMVYYCNESIWYQDKIYQYYMMYQCDVIYQYDITRQQWYDDVTRQQWYDISVWHATTAVWYDILSQTCVTGIMTFRCFDPSVCWPFGAPVFGVSVVFFYYYHYYFYQTMWSYWRDFSYEWFRTTKEWDIVKRKFLFVFSAQYYDTFLALASLFMEANWCQGVQKIGIS